MQPRLAPPSDLPPIRERLQSVFGVPPTPERRMDPLSQLIKAVISSRTYDEVAWAAFIRLQQAYPDWRAMGEAAPDAVEQVIDPVTFAEAKARQLPMLIRTILRRRGSLDLDFLGAETVEAAMAWLQGLNGVGVTSAAATLNFSRLNRRALVVDGHVHRVARRLGLVPAGEDESAAYRSLMEQAPADWGPEDLHELHGLLRPYGQSICTHFDPACGLCALRGTCPRVGAASDQEARVLAFRARTGS
jgi:endonuclease-3